MKYCTSCGHQMEDDMVFCQKCGAQVSEPAKNGSQPNKNLASNLQAYNGTDSFSSLPQTLNPKKRTGMKTLSIICFVFAIIYFIMACATDISMLGMVAFMGILGVMFMVLSKFPKEQKEITLKGGNKQIKKSNFIIACVCLAFILFSIFLIAFGDSANTDKEGTAAATSAAPSAASEETPTPSTEPELIIDVTKFANISSAELKQLLGEPTSIESSTYEGTISVPCEYYYYNTVAGLGEVDFTLINDKVIMMLTYTDLPYNKGEDILARVGITEPTNLTKTVDEDTVVRYRCPTDIIDDVWVGLIDSSSNTFGFLRVTYDLYYSEEWYIPLSIEEQSTYQILTQDSVESILKSPKSADFPWADWSYGKNRFYIAVQSYVDAENSFGAEIRSNFTFYYSSSTGALVYAVFDGEEVYNNGYVPFTDLVKQQASA